MAAPKSPACLPPTLPCRCLRSRGSGVTPSHRVGMTEGRPFRGSSRDRRQGGRIDRCLVESAGRPTAGDWNKAPSRRVACSG